MRQIVVTYDIVRNSRRNRVAKFLKGFLDRVQKSVFEGPIAERRLEKLRSGLAERIDQEQDTVRIYTLCPRCRAATEIIGTGVYVDDEESDVVV